MTAFLVEKEPLVDRQGGLTIPPPLKKLGYKGVESTELVFEGHRVPAGAVLGGEAGVDQGFYQMMAGIEPGRINVAARGLGAAMRALERVRPGARRLRQADRPPPGDPAEARQHGDGVEASKHLISSPRRARSRRRAGDVEAGMAKLFATEVAQRAVEDAMRIHGGYGYSKEYEIERLYRDTPLLLIGEGTSEIQQLIIARGMLARNPV